MLTSFHSLNLSNPGLLKAFNDVFMSTDLAPLGHRASLRSLPAGDLVDSEIDSDLEILDAMPDGKKNWLEG